VRLWLISRHGGGLAPVVQSWMRASASGAARIAGGNRSLTSLAMVAARGGNGSQLRASYRTRRGNS